MNERIFIAKVFMIIEGGNSTIFRMAEQRGPFEKFVDSPYYSESVCGGVVMVSFSKYLTWQAMHFLQHSTHFSKTYLE
jgi:hypothetical protein